MANQNDNRLRASIPITGLDTATPDISVQDGKCAELHNLRWASSGWRDVKPLETKVDFNDTAGTLPISLKIVYHHPAAGDDVYIASIEGSGDTINLCQVQCVDGEIQMLNPIGSNVNPIYVYHYRDSNMRVNMALRSFKPVASDVSAYIGYIDYYTQSKDGDTFTIKKGETISESIKYATAENIPSAPEPASDSTYSYPIFMSKAEALIEHSVIVRNISADAKFSHFGNVLVVSDPQAKRVKKFVLHDGEYLKYEIPTPPLLQILTLNTKTLPFKNGSFYHVLDIPHQPPMVTDDWFSIVPICNTSENRYLLSEKYFDGYWHGEICYFAALKMKDGTHLSPTELHLAVSELSNCDESARTISTHPKVVHRVHSSINYTHGKYFGWECDHLFYLSIGEHKEKPVQPSWQEAEAGTMNICIKPVIRITLPCDISRELFESVTVFSTRINPLFDMEKMKNIAMFNTSGGKTDNYISTDANVIYSENDLPNQPFYVVKDIPLDDFAPHDLCVVELTHDLLNGIEHNQVYKATQGMHAVYYEGLKEYNSRAHIYNLSTFLYSGYKRMCHAYDSNPLEARFSTFTTIPIGSRNYITQANEVTTAQKTAKIISYPDHRATQIALFDAQNKLMEVNMKPALGNNFAFACRLATEYEAVGVAKYNYVKYPCFDFNVTLSPHPTPYTFMHEPWRIQTSALNNLLSLPFEHSYAIGTESNKVINLNSAAIEMSDAKFGEFPLYAFTEEGVFALQSGSGEVLYSAVIPLNYDKIINSHTLAVNHNVLYITSRGVHAMSSNKGNLISQPLNDLHDSPPLNYLKDAQLCYQHPFNEVIIWNPNLGDWAYIYSLDGGYWSTRYFKGDKLNTDEFVVQHTSGSYQILDLNSEVASSTPTEIKLITRPIKFGSMEFKRLETLIPRLTADIAVDMHIELEASQDRLTWLPLRGGDFSVLRDLTLRRVPFSFRYLRISITAQVPSNLELSGIDAEFYNRFTHKLR